jgi:hypothetical protein
MTAHFTATLAASIPGLNQDALKALLASSPSWALPVAGRAHALNEELTQSLSENTDPLVRKKIAARTDTPEKIRERLLADTNASVRAEAFLHIHEDLLTPQMVSGFAQSGKVAALEAILAREDAQQLLSGEDAVTVFRWFAVRASDAGSKKYRQVKYAKNFVNAGRIHLLDATDFLPEYFTSTQALKVLKSYSYFAAGLGKPVNGRNLHTQSVLFSALADGERVPSSVREGIGNRVVALEQPGSDELARELEKIFALHVKNGGDSDEQATPPESSLAKAGRSPGTATFQRARAEGVTAQEIMTELGERYVYELPALIRVFPENLNQYFTKLDAGSWPIEDGWAHGNALRAIVNAALGTREEERIVDTVIETFVTRATQWPDYMRDNVGARLGPYAHRIPLPLLRDTGSAKLTVAWLLQNVPAQHIADAGGLWETWTGTVQELATTIKETIR